MSLEQSPARPVFRRMAVRLGLVPTAVEAALELTLALVLTRFPERWYFRRYGLEAAGAWPGGIVAADPAIARRAALTGHVVRRMAGVLPIGAVCLQQSLATRRMLRRRGIPAVIVFGIRRGGDASHDAHAWVEAAGTIVNGARPDLAGFDPVGRYG